MRLRQCRRVSTSGESKNSVINQYYDDTIDNFIDDNVNNLGDYSINDDRRIDTCSHQCFNTKYSSAT